MFFTAHLELLENFVPEIEKRINALEGHQVDVGMFASQGQHEGSGFTYVGLFKYMADGDPKRNMPPRSPLHVVANMNKTLRKSGLKGDIQKYLTNIRSTKGSITKTELLNNLGEHYREEVRNVFGDESKLAPKNAKTTKPRSVSPNTPLVETGELAKKVAYRVDGGSPNEIGR